MACANVFWVDDVRQLICDFSLIPSENDSLKIAMNKITRIALILGGVVTVFSLRAGIVVLVLSFVFIISIYYGLAKSEQYIEIDDLRESFGRSNQSQARSNYSSDYGEQQVVLLPQFNPVTSARFCNDSEAIAPNDPDYTSQNHLLVGWGYPKTRVPPIVAPPSHDIGAWSDSDLTRRNQINRKKPFDLYRSGFDSCNSFSDPRRCLECLNTLCTCDTRLFNQYKDNVLTQTIQPGVFQKTLAGEPINSLIGISYQQQFLPTVVQQNSDSVKFTQVPMAVHRQSLSSGPYSQSPSFDDVQDYSNVYDPRFTGYGASDRAYVEPMTGQTRFFYRDVDAVKMPNYITRSKIDNLPWAPTYGPDVPPIQAYAEHRQMANNAFHDSSLQFRTEMQERLMRKRNAELWQRRLAPISTNQQIGLGSIKSCS